MDNVDRKFIVIGIVYVFIGMAHGVYLGMAGDYTFAPLHAHINLLGSYAMLIFGLFYRAYPNAKNDPLIKAHFWFGNLAFLWFFVGIWLAISGITNWLGHTGGMAVLVTYIIFLVIVLRQTRGTA